jgi:cold shock CspA family protein
MADGTIVSVKTDRGFGFISRSPGDEIFFHCTELDPTLEFSDRLIEMAVTFDVGEGSQRRPRAVNVRPAR